MSRSGYHDGCGEEWASIRWLGAVASALRGKRGQAFLRESIEALDALSEPKLTANAFGHNGCYCVLGAVGLKRGLDLAQLETGDPEMEADLGLLSETFGIAKAMAAEMMYVNDEDYWGGPEPEEHRWIRVRAWLVSKLKPESPEGT